MKIKHLYSVHHLLDSYPSELDVLFDIVKYLQGNGKPLDDEWSDLGIKVALADKVDQEELNRLLLSLTNQGYLNRKEGSGKRSYYSVLKNPFEA